jgi:hypothetical protein
VQPLPPTRYRHPRYTSVGKWRFSPGNWRFHTTAPGYDHPPVGSVGWHQRRLRATLYVADTFNNRVLKLPVQ